MQRSSEGRRQISVTIHCNRDFIQCRQFTMEKRILLLRPNFWFREIVVLFRKINIFHFSFSPLILLLLAFTSCLILHTLIRLPYSCGFQRHFSRCSQCHFWIFPVRNIKQDQHTFSPPLKVSSCFMFYKRTTKFWAASLSKPFILIYTLKWHIPYSAGLSKNICVRTHWTLYKCANKCSQQASLIQWLKFYKINRYKSHKSQNYIFLVGFKHQSKVVCAEITQAAHLTVTFITI